MNEHTKSGAPFTFSLSKKGNMVRPAGETGSARRNDPRALGAQIPSRTVETSAGRCATCGRFVSDDHPAIASCDDCVRVWEEREAGAREAEASRARATAWEETLKRAGAEAYVGASFATWRGPVPRPVAEWVRALAKSGRPGSLILHGPPGRGKTHIALACARRAGEVLGLSVEVLLVPLLAQSVRSLINAERSGRSTDAIDPRPAAGRAALAVLDDVHRAEDALSRAALAEVVFARSYRGAPSIVTLNRDPRAGGSDPLGDPALWSRLVEGALIAEMSAGPDRRSRPIGPEEGR